MDDRAFRARLAAAAAAVETELDAFLSLEPRPGEPARPRRLLEAMRYSTLGGGKRLRPFLVIETARALGRSDAGPVRAAAAIECVHAYSLIHDDLPAMDDDDLRRGRPTAHRAFDEATAILAGDALLTLAFEILADPRTRTPTPRRARALCAGLARAAGLAGMVGGQMLDIAAETSAAPLLDRGDRAAAGDEDRARCSDSASRPARCSPARAAPALAALSALRRGDRRGVPGRRRPSRRRGRRGDAGQARRQGRRAQQGDARRGARRRGRPTELAALVGKAKAAVDAAGLGDARRRSASDGRFRRGAKELTVPISRARTLKTPSAVVPLTAPLSLPPARRDSRGRARS